MPKRGCIFVLTCLIFLFVQTTEECPSLIEALIGFLVLSVT